MNRNRRGQEYGKKNQSKELLSELEISLRISQITESKGCNC